MSEAGVINALSVLRKRHADSFILLFFIHAQTKSKVDFFSFEIIFKIYPSFSESKVKLTGEENSLLLVFIFFHFELQFPSQ